VALNWFVSFNFLRFLFFLINHDHAIQKMLLVQILMCKLVQGQHISLTQQIQQFTDTFQQFILSMGEDAATNIVSNSVFYISIGINDYIHYYLLNVSNVDNLYLPWHFNHFLASSLWQEIKVKTVLKFNFSVIHYTSKKS